MKPPKYFYFVVKTTLTGIELVDRSDRDVVEVVRCGDCKHYKEGFCYNPNTYDDEKTCGNTTEEWFCADGERRTE